MTPAILMVRKSGVAHEILEYAHDPAVASYGQEAADALGVDAASVFKTLVADVEGVGLVCAVVPVSAMLDLKALADAVRGRRAKMADQAAAERATGYVVGGISPLGQKKPLPVVLDASALSLARVFVSAGRRGLELALAPADLLKLARARTGHIARNTKSTDGARRSPA
jgi:Cys-tRNA(Pro)/Cys-tRNA(Cys) deacylase